MEGLSALIMLQLCERDSITEDEPFEKECI